jgi:hypothetical protein
MIYPVYPRFRLVGHAIALIGDPLTLVGRPLAIVGPPVTLVRDPLALLELTPPLLQPGRLRTGALSSVTNLLSDPTPLGGLVALSELLARLSVPRNQTSATFERLGQSHVDFDHATRVHRWTHRHA